MRTIVCTSNGGPHGALVAAATAVRTAASGQRTLLASVGPVHQVGTILGVPAATGIQAVSEQLDLWVIDPATELSTFVEDMRTRMRAQIPNNLQQVSADELPLVLGIDFLLALERLSRVKSLGYQVLVLDAGAHDVLLRVLALPDSVRWGTRLLFGLDREPGKSSGSVARAVIPTTFLPPEWIDGVQEARVQFEQGRDELTDPRHTTVRYVVPATDAAVQAARVSVPALHLNGLALDALVCGPLLPDDARTTSLAALWEEQQAALGAMQQTWHPLPVLHLPMLPSPTSVPAVAMLAEQLYSGADPLALPEAMPPIVYGAPDSPSVAIRLPGVQRADLNLTVSGDELIVRVGPYRRHVLLPDSIRAAQGNVKASREQEWLVVRPRA